MSIDSPYVIILLSFSENGIYMSTGHVEYASLDGTHIFKLIGEVRAQSCISLDKLLNRIEQQKMSLVRS